jgi:hypothetical protein
MVRRRGRRSRPKRGRFPPVFLRKGGQRFFRGRRSERRSAATCGARRRRPAKKEGSCGFPLGRLFGCTTFARGYPLPSLEGHGEGNRAPSTLSPTPLPSRAHQGRGEFGMWAINFRQGSSTHTVGSCAFSSGSLVWLHDVRKRSPLPLWERDRERGNRAPSTLSPAPLPSRERGARLVTVNRAWHRAHRRGGKSM